jgi:hypothetical protein
MAMMTARLVPSPRQAFGDDAAGFGYFATDFHYQNVAVEIRRHLARQRGFVLVNGPPAPDGKLISKYLDGANFPDQRDASRDRATLVRCGQSWTFGDVVIACGRELGLSADAGALRIWTQVMKDSRWGLTRILIIDNADALDDDSFDELYRFAKLDDSHVLAVVLLVGPGFADRLETRLHALKPAIVAAVPVQRLAIVEVAAFIRYQMEPLGADAEAFAPEIIAVIADTAQGDPRMVNRLARQSLELFASSRRAPPPPPPAPPPVAAPSAPEVRDAPAPKRGEMVPALAPSIQPPLDMASAMASAAAAIPNGAARSGGARFARGMTVAAGFLVVEVFAIALLGFYALAPHDWFGGPQSASVAPVRPVAAVADLGSRRPSPAEPVAATDEPTSPIARAEPASPARATAPARPPSVPKTTAVVPPPPPPAVPKVAAKSLDAAARLAATIEPSAPAKSDPLTDPDQSATPPMPLGSSAAADAAARAKITALATPAPADRPLPRVTAPVTTGAQVATLEPTAPATTRVGVPTARSTPQDPAAAAGAALLVQRGDQLLAAGDIASARQFFERAVEAGDIAASCDLGKSYDPLFLQQRATLRGVAPDPSKAAAWYQRAARAGNDEAATRLTQLLARYPSAIQADGSSQ